MKQPKEKETGIAAADQDKTQESGTDTKQSEKKAMHLPWTALGTLLGSAALILLAYGLYTGMTTFLMVELLLAITALAVGCLLGFLFGMPHSSVGADGGAPGSDRVPVRYSPSTNLGQVADWLTKILIGVGLVEIRQIGEALERMGSFVQRSIEGAPSVTNFVSQIVVIAFVVGGFLASFLWTRIFYGPLQTITDSNVLTALQRRIESLRSKLSRQQAETEEVKTVTQLMARGELGVAYPGGPGAISLGALGELRDARLWPDDIRERIEKFQKAPKKWNSDPAGRLFRDATREDRGYRFEAELHQKLSDAVIITLRVRRVDGERTSGQVTFLLHPTLRERVQYAELIDGIAETKIYAEGWFTAVAIIDAGSAILKFDLREIEGVPAWFKEEEE